MTLHVLIFFRIATLSGIVGLDRFRTYGATCKLSIS